MVKEQIDCKCRSRDVLLLIYLAMRVRFSSNWTEIETATDRVEGVSCSSSNGLMIEQTGINMNLIFVFRFAATFICQGLYNLS